MSFSVGGGADSWCGPCSRISRHVVLTLKGIPPNAEPQKVECDCCGKSHQWRNYLPGQGPKGVKQPQATIRRKPQQPKPEPTAATKLAADLPKPVKVKKAKAPAVVDHAKVASILASLPAWKPERPERPYLELLDAAIDGGRNDQPYRMEARYAAGDLISHHRFGFGVVKESDGRRISVAFESGSKMLACGRT